MRMTEEALAALDLPCYVLDLPRLEQKYAAFQRAFSSTFPKAIIGLSYKTSYLPALLRHLHQRGAHAEVVSDLEYELAERLGVPPEKIIYNGPGKSREAIARALGRGSLVNLDSMEEVAYVVASAAELRRGPKIGLRINLMLPEKGASRFGIEVESGDFALAVERLRAAGLEILGLHAHLTSKSRTLDHYRLLVRALNDAARRAGLERILYLDVGGGFGAAHPEMPAGVTFPSFEQYAGVLSECVREGPLSPDSVTLITEPGIALTCDSLAMWCSVLAVKILGGRRVAVVDASVQTVKPTKHALNLPTRGFGADFVEKRGEAIAHDVVGYTCLEDDVIAKDVALPALKTGDVLRIDNVGAYTYVFKPAFIRGMPSFYAWDGIQAKLVRRADRFDDVFGCYVL